MSTDQEVYARASADPLGDGPPEPPAIRLDGVTRRFGETVAVDGIDLELRAGEFFALLGPSGCGKTTTLRMVGGFELPSAGTVYLDGRDVTGLPPYKRDVNTVFQSYALFPHLTVFDNVAFGLRRRRRQDRAEIRRLVEENLELVGLAGYGRRRPTQISGGQAAAGGAGAGSSQRTEGAAARRADGGARRTDPQDDAGGAQADPARGRDHVPVCDPRPGRGDGDVRPAGGDARRALRGHGIAFSRLRPPGDALHGGVPRQLQQARADGRRRSRAAGGRHRRADAGRRGAANRLDARRPAREARRRHHRLRSGWTRRQPTAGDRDDRHVSRCQHRVRAERRVWRPAARHSPRTWTPGPGCKRATGARSPGTRRTASCSPRIRRDRRRAAPTGARPGARAGPDRAAGLPPRAVGRRRRSQRRAAARGLRDPGHVRRRRGRRLARVLGRSSATRVY